MANSPPRIEINLSHTKMHVTLEKVILRWITNVGKIVIIVTELIALGTLAYRFKIDGEIVDLHDKIKAEEQQLSVRSQDEKKYRDLQKRLLYIKSISENARAKILVLQHILDEIHNGAFFTTNVVVNQNVIAISGNSPTVQTVNDFITSIKKNKDVDSISIDDFTSIEQGVQIKLSIALKPSQNELP